MERYCIADADTEEILTDYMEYNINPKATNHNNYIDIGEYTLKPTSVFNDNKRLVYFPKSKDLPNRVVLIPEKENNNE